MRISDWSSDVCSSDLERQQALVGLDDRLPGGSDNLWVTPAEIDLVTDALLAPHQNPLIGDILALPARLPEPAVRLAQVGNEARIEVVPGLLEAPVAPQRLCQGEMQGDIARSQLHGLAAAPRSEEHPP